uniref:Uncharacterized protein n=1 Tax=Meloidogyne enterolobii TaxID=390850 RepID=A0A6V7WUI3_MELEN|nr:unnamed protein product [Meloidogyne enterolobii]
MPLFQPVFLSRRSRRRNHQNNNNEHVAHASNPTHPGIEGAVIYEVQSPPNDGVVRHPDGTYEYAHDNQPSTYTSDPAHEEPHIDDAVIYDVPSPPSSPREGIVQLPGTNNYAYARTQQPPRNSFWG